MRGEKMFKMDWNQLNYWSHYSMLSSLQVLEQQLAFMSTQETWSGWKADVLSAFLLAGPVVLFLIYNYFVLYHTGVAAFPTFSLSAILCVGLVPTLSVAGIVSRRFSQKTGNIWTAVFFNTMFFTLITLANTIVYVLSFR